MQSPYWLCTKNIGSFPSGLFIEMSWMLSSCNKTSIKPNPTVYLTKISVNLINSFSLKRIFFAVANSSNKSFPILKKTCLILSGSVNSSCLGLCSAKTFLAVSKSSYLSSDNLNSGGTI